MSSEESKWLMRGWVVGTILMIIITVILPYFV